MKRSLLVLALICVALPLNAHGEEGGVFLSLTRKPERFADLPTNVSVISSPEIKEMNARNLGEILENHAGLNRSTQGSFGSLSTVSMRGSTSEQVLVMIDGRRINSISLGNANLSEIPADAIERIEIIRGAASAVYGTNAVGGTVNIITKKAQENVPVAEFAGQGASFLTQNYQFALNLRGNGISGVGTASRALSGGFRKNSDYENRNIFARLGLESGTAGTFDLSGSYFASELGIPGQAINPATSLPLTVDEYDGEIETTAPTPDARQKTDRRYVRVEHTKQWSRNALKTGVYASRDLTDYRNPSQPLNSEYSATVYGGEAKFDTAYGITAGGEWWEERYLQTDRLLAQDIVDRSRVNTALYLQQQLRAGKLLVIPGLRSDQNSAFGNVLSPKVTLVYQASERLKLSANSGKAWRSPTFSDLFWPTESFTYLGTAYVTTGNSALRPETGIASDAGIEYRRNGMTAGLTAFLIDTDDLISWQGVFDAGSNTFTYQPQNVSRARQTGAELRFSQRIVSGLTQELDYTYLRAEDRGTGSLLTYRPRNTLNYSLSYAAPWNGTIRATTQYVGPRATENTSLPEIPGYTLLGLKITRRVSDAELWLSAENLTNVRYQTRLGYPLPGATLSAGFNLRFWSY